MVNQEDYLRSIIGDEKFWSTCPPYFMCGTPLDTDVGSEGLVKQDLEKARACSKKVVTTAKHLF
ncbi:MAG: hypothetical protein CM1200mP41_02030 [Gammaproteobacteria bacterium]|nr:MAG: hypothetical protein CM1200mP41_02030 [Gammaproteobacteria bacterium]